MRNFLAEKWHDFRASDLRKKVIVAGILGAGFLALTPLITYAYFARDISSPERLMNRNNTGIVLLDRNGETFYSFGKTKQQDVVPLDRISDDLEKAVIASEDKNFYEHNGFSTRGIVGALYANILNRDATAYGGSTITQQLVKNTLLTNDKNYLRKYQELSIAVAVERQYSKDEILQMYLNSVYYGEGAFGIEPAAKAYFNKTPQELTLAESAMLIGLLPAPSAYSPVSGDKELAKQQQKKVLDRMVEEGYITKEQQEAAFAAEIAYAPANSTEDKAPHFTQMVLSELNEKYGEERVTRSGYQVKTTLDLNWQTQAQQIVSDRMASIKSMGGSNAALVAIDPKSGEIRALVGSADWENAEYGKVNMAITPRQPGSSFKPIYYTEALGKGIITPATILQDKPKSWGEFKPNNYDFRFRGDITVRNALATSLNIPAVEVMDRLGVDQAIDTSQRMGIDTITDQDASRYGLSLALGAASTKLSDMTNAYAAFANGGRQYKPTMILSIDNKFGRTIFTSKNSDKRVVSEEASFLISDILSDNSARAPTFGGSLNVAGRDVAVKTGTTDDYRDAWTIGYTPSLAVGVWVGNNNNEPMSFGGSTFAGPIWRSSMQQFLAGSPVENFTQPNGVEQMLICRSNGLRAASQFDGTYSEYFIRGTAPTGSCQEPKKEEPKKKEEKPKEEKPEEDPIQDEPDRAPKPDEDEQVEDTPPGSGDSGGDPESPEQSGDGGSSTDGTGAAQSLPTDGANNGSGNRSNQ